MTQIPGTADHAAPAPSFVARARKFLVAAIGLLVQVIASGVFDEPRYDTLRTVVMAVVAVATAAGVYQVRNAAAK